MRVTNWPPADAENDYAAQNLLGRFLTSLIRAASFEQLQPCIARTTLIGPNLQTH